MATTLGTIQEGVRLVQAPSAMRLCRETLRLVRVEFGEKAKQPRLRTLLGEPLEKHGL
jgi:hypothetical protein